MSFKNPSVISSVSKEEFDKLKQEVSEMHLSLNDLIEKVETTNYVEDKKNSITIDNGKKYTKIDKDIRNATLTGVPRIDFFNFSKPLIKNTIIDIDTIMNKKKYNIKSLDSIPNSVKTSNGHRTILMPDSKIEKIKSNNISKIQII